MILYVCHQIRGLQGESASEHYQRANIQMAIAKGMVLKDQFPSIEWVIPHANDIVNELYFRGYVKGDDIVDVECHLIRTKYDGIVVIGDYYHGTGVAREIEAACEADKFICFIDDVGEQDRMLLAQEIQKWQ